MKQQIKEFVTMGDLVNYVTNTPIHPSNVDGRRSSRDTTRPGFHGTDNYDEACKLARDGWPEGLEKLTSKLDLCLGKGKSRYRVNDVAGDYPDIGRFLSGVPVCMSRRVIDQGRKRPIIDIIMNVSYSGNTSQDAIINYGAAVASAVDELETAGFRVNIQIGCMVKGNETGTLYGCLVNAKTAGESLDLDRLIFFIAHPSFFRRFGFGYFEIAMNYDELGYGYGKVGTMDQKDLGQETIFFPGSTTLNNDCRSLDKARDYVKGIIRGSRPDLFNDVSEAA